MRTIRIKRNSYYVLEIKSGDIVALSDIEALHQLAQSYENEIKRLRDALESIHAGNTMQGRDNWTHADVLQKHYQICRNALRIGATTMNKHTPNYIVDVVDGHTWIFDETNGIHVAKVYDVSQAPFIVRAVNSHDDMLEALKELLDNAEVDALNEPELEPACQRARAAIQKATGETHE